MLLMLLGAVALVVAVAFAFAVAVAVTDIRLTSLIRPIRLYMRKRVPKARHRKGTFVALLRKLLLLVCKSRIRLELASSNIVCMFLHMVSRSRHDACLVLLVRKIRIQALLRRHGKNTQDGHNNQQHQRELKWLQNIQIIIMAGGRNY